VYDGTGLFFKEVDNFVMVAVAAPPGGGRSVLTQRFTRHFSIFNVQKTSDDTLNMIFGSIVRGFLKSNAFKSEIVELESNIVQATLTLYNK
jgi:dynein heavy chain